MKRSFGIHAIGENRCRHCEIVKLLWIDDSLEVVKIPGDYLLAGGFPVEAVQALVATAEFCEKIS